MAQHAARVSSQAKFAGLGVSLALWVGLGVGLPAIALADEPKARDDAQAVVALAAGENAPEGMTEAPVAYDLAAPAAVPAPTEATPASSIVNKVNVYRLYNPQNGEHLYTRDANEVKVLTTQHGWTLDGKAVRGDDSGRIQSSLTGTGDAELDRTTRVVGCCAASPEGGGHRAPIRGRYVSPVQS